MKYFAQLPQEQQNMILKALKAFCDSERLPDHERKSLLEIVKNEKLSNIKDILKGV